MSDKEDSIPNVKDGCGPMGVLIIIAILGMIFGGFQKYWEHQEKMAKIKAKTEVKQEFTPPVVELGEATDGGSM